MSEPNYWEQRYLEKNTPWDRGAPAPPLEEFLARHRISGRVLVPGCGRGHDVRLLASQGAIPVGLDISPTALALAKGEKRTGSEEYLLGDLFNLPASLAGSFDWVWEHTCFCAIDPGRRPDYVQSVRRALKPGGQLLGVFYIDPQAEQGPPFRVSRDELRVFFDADFAVVEEWLPSRTYPGRENCEWMRWMRRKQ